MSAKIISSVFFIVFVAVQFAQGKTNTTKTLQCYSCYENSCKNAVLETCDKKAANATYSKMMNDFPVVDIKPFSDFHFSCLESSYKSNNKTVMQVKGCVDFDPCHLIPHNATWRKDHCKFCDDKNGCNPAGTISSSTSIMILSVFGLVLAKLFNM